MNMAVRFLNDLFTQSDNKTFCLGRVLWAISVFTYLSLNLGDVFINGTTFKAIEFGTGLGITLGGGGLGIKAYKDKEEKRNKKEEKNETNE